MLNLNLETYENSPSIIKQKTSKKYKDFNEYQEKVQRSKKLGVDKKSLREDKRGWN
jgi:hypothetical protein